MSENYLAGVTVLPEYFQSEGVEAVLDRLQHAGVNTIATSPYVMEPATEDTGAREPPADAGAGSVRLLDRPLWGKYELFVRTEPSFQPDTSRYSGMRYQPATAGELSRREGAVVRKAFEAAHSRGMRVYLQVQAAIPPGYRVQFGGPHEEDLPRMPDGSVPQNRVANNGSLCAPAILEYQQAFIHDLIARYPDVDGIRFDWPEYPPYRWDSIFVDFSSHAEQASGLSPADYQHLRHEINAVKQFLSSAESTEVFNDVVQNGGEVFWNWWHQQRGVDLWLTLKNQAVSRLIQTLRHAMNDAGGEKIRLAPASFPAPWSFLSGMHGESVYGHCDEVAVKFYGMHWLMMLGFYHQQIAGEADAKRSATVARALPLIFDCVDLPNEKVTPETLSYPAPDQPHLMNAAIIQRKLQHAHRHAGDQRVHALAHSYGPVSDFQSRLEATHAASRHGLWINRYAYLSDEKLSAVRQVLSGDE